MKNIVICCDGTGNEFGDANSNVVKLYTALAVNGEQAGYYHPGVGTMGAPAARNRVAREWSRIKGLAFGSGLLDNVADAYRFLMDVYREGDRVYLFGFSRGAYTVRVLGGVLHMFGLLCPGNAGHIPYVMRMYAKRRREARRQQQSSQEDTRFKYTFSRDIKLHFVGVWDTVSSFGWVYDPVQLPSVGQNPIIQHGRHAISIDERRCFYLPMLWGDSLADQDLRQVWFSGVHSDVGGSYPERESGLSKVTLRWMLEQARDLGLRVDDRKLRCVLGEGSAEEASLGLFVRPDAGAPVHCSLNGLWWLLELLPQRYNKGDLQKVLLRWRVPLGTYRSIPEGSTIYDAARARLAAGRLPKTFQTEAPARPSLIYNE